MDFANKTAKIFTNSTNASGLVNASFAESGEYFFEENSCPEWIIYAFFAFISWGTFVNLVESLALLCSKKNGKLNKFFFID